MVTLPQQISEIYRNTATLSFDLFVRGFHESFGMSSTGVNKMWEVPMAHEKHQTQQDANIWCSGQQTFIDFSCSLDLIWIL